MDRQYTYILEIVKTESVSVAAENLGISQPALSKYVKKVEKEIGAEIFDRSTVPISLTDAGRCYVNAARKIVDANSQLQKEMEEIFSARNAEIKIGISPSRAPYLLPAIIPDFLKKTNARVIVEEGTTTELNEKLLRGNIDLSISIPNSETAGFERIVMFEEEVLLAVPCSFEEEEFEAAIGKLPVISPGKGQVMWELLDDINGVIGGSGAMIECQNMVTALALAASGAGVTLVPSYMRDFAKQDNIKFIPIPKKYFDKKREVCIFYRKEQYLSRTEKCLIECSLNSADKQV